MNPRWLITAVAAALLATPAMASTSLDRSAQITFGRPVELPGRVLPAGTYIFEQFELGKITRVWNADGRQLIGTFDTVPYEQREGEKTSDVILKKGPNNSPVRIDTWFYPGDSIGSEFIYPSASVHQNVGSRLREKPASLLEHGTAKIGDAGLHSAEALVQGVKRLI